MIEGFVRVSKSRPCPICHKPDWCLVAKDGSCAICPRTPSSRLVGEAGFFHAISADAAQYQATIRSQPPREVKIDAPGICREYQDAMTEGDYNSLSVALGVTRASLQGLGVGRAYHYCEGTYAFPMRDATDNIIGVRLRNRDGHKWAVYGSRSGLFYSSIEPDTVVYICEGPTDTAAILDLGLIGLGKPSCSSGNDMILTMMRKLMPPMVVVVSDVDGKDGVCSNCGTQTCQQCRPGQYGAERTARGIASLGIDVKVIEPLGAKDMRAWKNRGAKASTVRAVVNNSPFFST